MGCRVNSGTVTVVDTWNPSPQRTANVLDATQNGLCVQSTSFTNGRITCRCVLPLINILHVSLPHSPLYRFSRTIAITDVGQDHNLDNSFNLLFGRRTTSMTCNLAASYYMHTFPFYLYSSFLSQINQVLHQH